MVALCDKLYGLSDVIDDAVVEANKLLKDTADMPKDVLEDMIMIRDTLNDFSLLCSDTAYDLTPEDEK